MKVFLLALASIAALIDTTNVKNLAIDVIEGILQKNNQTNSMRQSVFDDPNYLQCEICYQLRDYLNKLSHHSSELYFTGVICI